VNNLRLRGPRECLNKGWNWGKEAWRFAQ
jgi:hypothetical protein